MRIVYLLCFAFLFINVSYAQNVFEYNYTTGYKAQDTEVAVEYIFRKLNPKFPKNVHVDVKNIVFDKDNIKFITFYYSEYDGATRGESKYFISFWKDYGSYFQCVGSNILNIYDPDVNISNNVITIKGKKRYEPLSIYYYSFFYKNDDLFYNNITSVSVDGDNKTTHKYYYSHENVPISINSVFADVLAKEE